MTPSQAVPRVATSTLSQLLRFTTALATLMLLAAALVHLSRSSQAGSIGRSELWLAALTCGAAILFFRIAWCRTLTRPLLNRTSIACWGVATLAVLLWGFSLTMNAGTRGDAPVIWFILLAFECCGWLALTRTGWLTAGLTALRSIATGDAETLTPRAASALPTETASGSRDQSARPLADEHVVQHFTRSRSDERGEFIHGLIRCRFAVGERTQIQHVAFCPPLDAPPSMLVDQIEGPAAKVKAAQVETFGARFEIRLGHTSRRSTVVAIEFFASTGDESRHTRAA